MTPPKVLVADSISQRGIDELARDGALEVTVKTGLSDGLMTQIVSGDIQEGATLVVGESHADANAGTKNPFTPKMFGGSGGKKE